MGHGLTLGAAAVRNSLQIRRGASACYPRNGVARHEPQQVRRALAKALGLREVRLG